LLSYGFIIVWFNNWHGVCIIFSTGSSVSDSKHQLFTKQSKGNTMETTTNTTTATITLTPSIDLMVDELGQLQDQAAALAAQIDTLKTTIKALGAGRYLGSRWQSVVTAESESDKVNWEAVAKYLNPSHQLITAHTKKVINVPRITTTLQKGKA
jgi:hypothetical protein